MLSQNVKYKYLNVGQQTIKINIYCGEGVVPGSAVQCSRGSASQVHGTGMWCFINELSLFPVDLVKPQQSV